MRALMEKRQTLLCCVAGVLVVLLFPGRMAWDSMQAGRAEADEIHVEIERLERQAELGAQVEVHRAEWDARLAALELAVPREEDFEAVNRQIAAAATATGVVWKAGRPDALTDSAKQTRTIGAARVYAIGLSDITGTEAQINEFIQAVAAIERIVVIDNIDWKRADGQVRIDVKAGYLAGGNVVAPDTGGDR